MAYIKKGFTTGSCGDIICTGECVHTISKTGYKDVWDLMTLAAQKYCSIRVRNELKTDIVYLDSMGNTIGKAME